MNKIEIRSLSNNELDSLYGDRKCDIGKCYIKKNEPNHYYMQREKDVLHIQYDEENKNYLINNLHVGFLNNNDIDFEKVSKSKFNEILLLTLVDLDIYKNIK